jgi:fructose/tagatose bisphosphate aldolase
MLFSSKDDLTKHLNGSATYIDGRIHIKNIDKFRNQTIDVLVKNSVLNPSKEIKGLCRTIIKLAANELGIISSSIQELYTARGKGAYKGFTVPAINIRGMSYDLSRAVFRSAHKINCGAFIFEIAKSEIAYTFQSPHELTPVILGAAIRENHQGPVFIQGDHFQVNAKSYANDPEKEVLGIKNLIQDAIHAGFYNIDIDTSTLVDLSKPNITEQQRANFEVGVDLTRHIRQLEPAGITVSVGGEIGEVGKQNSTEEELLAYMSNFNQSLNKDGTNHETISKISIQTGTEHGGVPLPDGTVADVLLDFATLENLSRISRESYGLAGAVQHGASTLPQDLFHKFPQVETSEIHLATNFQNMIYDSKYFPQDLKKEIYEHLRIKFAAEKKDGMTDEQFIYKTRKKGFGEFKPRFWSMDDDIRNEISNELEAKFDFLFDQLKVGNTMEMVNATISPVTVAPNLEEEIAAS